MEDKRTRLFQQIPLNQQKIMTRERRYLQAQFYTRKDLAHALPRNVLQMRTGLRYIEYNPGTVQVRLYVEEMDKKSSGEYSIAQEPAQTSNSTLEPSHTRS